MASIIAFTFMVLRSGAVVKVMITVVTVVIERAGLVVQVIMFVVSDGSRNGDSK